MTKDKKAKDQRANLLGAVATESRMSLNEVKQIIDHAAERKKHRPSKARRVNAKHDQLKP